MQRIISLLIWTGIIFIVLAWLPVLALARLMDREPALYKTGRLFRQLGKLISRFNPNWKVTVEGHESINDREPYVVVCNHLSNADIPVISNLPWEMKWVAKRELFEIPVVGWMMKLAGDIPVDRISKTGQITTFRQAMFCLQNKVSVIFFPEGTRSADGRLKRFTNGAFDLAIRQQVPVLPLVIDGTHGALPKNSWVFKPDVHARLAVLAPVSTKGMSQGQVEELKSRVREQIATHLMSLRNTSRMEVDATVTNCSL